jgi:uncharacterized membrane protein
MTAESDHSRTAKDGTAKSALEPKAGPATADEKRRLLKQRLTEALRENLRRRNAQRHGRSGKDPGRPAEAAD